MCQGAKAAEPADVFSLAVLMAELISGVVPFAHLDNDIAIGMALNRGERPALPSPDASDLASCEVVELIGAAWAEDPSARPEAAEVYGAIVAAARLAEAGEVAAERRRRSSAARVEAEAEAAQAVAAAAEAVREKEAALRAEHKQYEAAVR